MPKHGTEERGGGVGSPDTGRLAPRRPSPTPVWTRGKRRREETGKKGKEKLICTLPSDEGAFPDLVYEYPCNLGPPR